MSTLGGNIKAARLAAGFRTQEALADELGVSRAAISQWERGETLPEPKRIPHLVKALRTTWEALSGEKAGPPLWLLRAAALTPRQLRLRKLAARKRKSCHQTEPHCSNCMMPWTLGRRPST